MALNPVELRLLGLRRRWEAFAAAPSKRLLVWEAPAAALRMIECFVEAQGHEAEYSTADLLILFKMPFEHSIQYSRALKETLAGRYAAGREALAARGITADWSLEPERLPDSAYGFVQALRSLGGRHHAHMGHLAAVLAPTGVSSDTAFADWLSRALAAGLPERLRLAVVDPAEAPRLRTLSGSGDPRIELDAPALDIMTVAQETFAQEAAVGPAAVFRNLLMSLVALVEKAPAAQVRLKAADAYEFARKQGWDDQQVAVSVLVAGAQMKEGRFDDALRTYGVAGTAARRATEAGHPAGRRLTLQIRFGEAGAHLAAGRVTEAAAGYDKAAELALAIPDAVLSIEALRMGAFCHARVGARDRAVELGLRALALGGRLRPGVRGMTTLPIAATDTLRVLDPERVERVEEIRARAEVRGDGLLADAERRAAQLERAPEPEVFRTVEANLAQGAARIRTEGERELRAIVAAADARFREVFATARGLLSEDWPLGLGADRPDTAPADGGGAAHVGAGAGTGVAAR